MTAPKRTRVGLAAVAAGIVAGVFLSVTDVAAHGGDQDTGPSNYAITIVNPGLKDPDWNEINGDAQVELTNSAGVEVTVLGCQDQPYLRFSPPWPSRGRAAPPGNRLPAPSLRSS